MCKQDTSFVFVKDDHSLRQPDRASIYFLNIQLPCAAHFVVFLFGKHKTPHSVTLPLTSHGIKAEYFVQLRCWPLFERQKRWNINTKARLNRMHEAFSGTMMPFRKNGKLSFMRPQKCPCSLIPTTAETTTSQNTDNENVQHECVSEKTEFVLTLQRGYY